MGEVLTLEQEEAALLKFKSENKDLFQKDDLKLYIHLMLVGALLLNSTLLAITVPVLIFKILFGAVSAFFWFCLINVTIHHHHTHKNAAQGEAAKKLLDFIYKIAVPNAPKRLNRYTRAHLNHHARPFHETDVDHHYGTRRYMEMMKDSWQKFLYYAELTFVGGHVPGWDDDYYMNNVPLEQWNREGYEKVKAEEVRKARITALWQWALFLVSVKFLPWIAWGWAFPMLLVKNWSHFLGQFQHYDNRMLDESATVYRRTKTYKFPSLVNYLTGGEISGHFLHHLYPEMPYYNVEAARLRFTRDPGLAKNFAIY
jgi:fatty acid desaturase